MTEATPPRGWRAFVAYSLARLGLFVAVAAVLLLVGLTAPVAVLLALLLSGFASYFLLNRQRGDLAATVEHAIAERRKRSAARAAREDEIAEQMIAEQSGETRQ